MEELNTTVQDARTLLKSAQKYAAGPDADGINPALASALATLIERAVAADTGQRYALRDVGRFTDAQDRAVKKGFAIIAKLRFAAKGCYGRADAQMMKEFAVGKPQAKTVKALDIDLAFMKKAAEKYLGDLTLFGFKAADLAVLTAAAAELEMADANQELAKKAQKNATLARNDTVKALQQTMQKVRATAKSVFAGRKDVLREFETITRAKGVRKAKEKQKPAAGSGAASSGVGAGA